MIGVELSLGALTVLVVKFCWEEDLFFDSRREFCLRFFFRVLSKLMFYRDTFWSSLRLAFAYLYSLLRIAERISVVRFDGRRCEYGV